MTMTRLKFAAAVIAAALIPLTASAQSTTSAVHPEVSFILTTLLFLIGGFLVFFMAAGFAMLEAGLVRSKNVTMQLTKNMALFGLAYVFYYLIGNYPAWV